MSVAEIIAMTRDIVFLVLLVIAILATLILYSKVSKVLDSAKRTVKDAEDIFSAVSSKVVGPAAAGSGAAFGAGKLMAFLLGFRKKNKKGGNNG